jgi:hypothetical protein
VCLLLAVDTGLGVPRLFLPTQIRAVRAVAVATTRQPVALEPLARVSPAVTVVLSLAVVAAVGLVQSGRPVPSAVTAVLALVRQLLVRLLVEPVAVVVALGRDLLKGSRQTAEKTAVRHKARLITELLIPVVVVGLSVARQMQTLLVVMAVRAS